MTGTNQYVPFATGDGALVIAPATYESLPSTQTGYQVGVADPATVNTTWRLASVAAAGLAQWIVNQTNVSMLDDGNVANFAAQIAAAISAMLPSSVAPGALWHVGVQSSGSASAIVANVSPAVSSRQANYAYLIVPTNACTGATTLNVGFGVSPLKRQDGAALVSGDYAAAQPLLIVDDGTNFRVIGLVPSQIGSSLIANNPSISPPRNLTAYLSAGTYTFTVPANVTWLYVQAVGGGGGGAGGSGGATWASAGGASGGYAAGWIAVTPSQAFTIVVGAGGSGAGNSNGALGGSGGTSSFGSSISATGGGGGTGGSSSCAGGLGGVGSGGQVNYKGAFGGDGNPYNTQIQGGAGGASAFGGGGRTSTTANGAMNGQAPGSGGGGVWDNRFPTTPQIGGNGADGGVLVQF